MKTTLRTDWTVGDICKGFVFDQNEGKGLFGLDGQLVIQPEYQRNYIYGDGKRDYRVSIKQSAKNETYALDLIKRIGFHACISSDGTNVNCNIYSKQLWELLSQW